MNSVDSITFVNLSFKKCSRIKLILSNLLFYFNQIMNLLIQNKID